MPKSPDTTAAQLRECLTRIAAADQVAVHTAKRLDRHIESSGEVHRDLKARLSVLEKLVRDILRQ